MLEKLHSVVSNTLRSLTLQDLLQKAEKCVLLLLCLYMCFHQFRIFLAQMLSMKRQQEHGWVL